MTTICQSKIDVVACQVAWHEKFVLSPAAFFSALTPQYCKLQPSLSSGRISRVRWSLARRVQPGGWTDGSLISRVSVIYDVVRA